MAAITTSRPNACSQAANMRSGPSPRTAWLRDDAWAVYSRECRARKLLGSLANTKNARALVQLLAENEEGLWSFTSQDIALEIARKILTLPGVTPNSTITDLMAGIGGNVIQFAQEFRHVNAIEIDPKRAKILRNNVDVFGFANVNVYSGGFQDHIGQLTQDIVYFDPPWGLNYKLHSRLRIMINGPNDSQSSLEQAVCDMRDRALYAVVKIPVNYDMDYFAQNTASVCCVVSSKNFTRPNSMRIIILRYIKC